MPTRQCGCLCSPLRITGALECIDRPCQFVAHPSDRVERLPCGEQQLGRGFLSFREQLQCLREEPCGCGVRAERERTLSRFRQRFDRSGCQMRHVVTCRSVELDRSQVVMSEGLGAILRAIFRQRLDPARRLHVAGGPCGAWELTVRRVSHECVDEGVLARSGDRRTVLPADELLPLERAKRLAELPGLDSSDRGEGVRPEHLAEDGGVSQQLLLGWRKQIDPRCDDSLNRVGKCRVHVGSGLEDSHELLGVQRVSSRALYECLLRLRIQKRALQQRQDEARRVLVRKRGE